MCTLREWYRYQHSDNGGTTLTVVQRSMKQGFTVKKKIKFVIFVCAKECMQGIVWIEPDKHESMLHMEEQVQYVDGCCRVCNSRPSVYGGSVCKDSVQEKKRDGITG